MSARTRRPQLLAQGARTVLLMSRDSDGRQLDRAVKGYERLTELGYVVTAVMDPADHLEAHRMLLDGVVDVITVLHPDDLPSVRLVYADDGARRTGLTPRAEAPRRPERAEIPYPRTGSVSVARVLEADRPPAEPRRTEVLPRRQGAMPPPGQDRDVPARQRRAQPVRRAS